MSDMPDYPFFGEWTFDYSPPERWNELLEGLCAIISCRLTNEAGLDPSDLKAVQVKSKFGGLRFYYTLEGDPSPAEEFIRGAVDMAETVSFSIK